MTSRYDVLRAITRTGPAWIPCQHDGCLTLLRPRVVIRPVESGRDDWGVGWQNTSEREGSYPDGKPVTNVNVLWAPKTDFDVVIKTRKVGANVWRTWTP